MHESTSERLRRIARGLSDHRAAGELEEIAANLEKAAGSVELAHAAAVELRVKVRRGAAGLDQYDRNVLIVRSRSETAEGMRDVLERGLGVSWIQASPTLGFDQSRVWEHRFKVEDPDELNETLGFGLPLIETPLASRKV